METYFYEDIETAVGNIFRRLDNYNVEEHHFFPVSFIDRLTHFAQDLSIVESRKNPEIKPNSYGSDFDIWVDNMAAKCKVNLLIDNEIKTVRLIDIAEMTFDGNGGVRAVTGNGEQATVLAGEKAMKAFSPADFKLKLTTHYDKGEVLEDIEGLASLFIRAGMAMKIEINNENRPRFEEPVFNYFKYSLIPMIPNILEDLETIQDENLVQLVIINE